MTAAESSDELYQAVRTVVRRRRTVKVLGSTESPPVIESSRAQTCDQLVRQSIEDAGWAPFHFDRHADSIAEPWRVYWLDQATCRVIAQRFAAWFGEIKPGNKMPALLSACGCLVLVTWLPQSPATGDDLEKLAGINEEHLAASAAFTQSLLLLLEAAGMGSYWSSGGLLRTPAAFQRLGIPADQRLTACVFVDYTPLDTARSVELAFGGQRARRSPAALWSRQIEIF